MKNNDARVQYRTVGANIKIFIFVKIDFSDGVYKRQMKSLKGKKKYVYEG